MSRVIFLFLTIITIGLNGQATQIDVKLNHIGINEPNPPNQVGRYDILNSNNIGSKANAIQIDASNNGTESTFGTNIQASNTGRSCIFSHYANVQQVVGGNAYAIFGRADSIALHMTM